MNVQKNYWIEMDQTIFGREYIYLYLSSSEKIDFFIKLITAITSSSSIAAWVIWQQYSWVWGSLIATSQVISATKNFLPWEQRSKNLINLYNEYQLLIVEFERNWYDVATGYLTEKKIHDLTVDLVHKRVILQSKHLKETLSKNKKYVKLAEVEKDIHLKKYKT